MIENTPKMPEAFKALNRLLEQVIRIREELRLEDLWWRGQPEVGLELKPKIFRKLDYPNVEYNYIHGFNRQAPIRYAAWPTERRHQLILMQHYGLPTRLLDWSQGLMIACYFAVNEDAQDKPASLWALNPYVLNKLQRPENSNPLSRIFPDTSKEIQSMVDLAFTPYNERACHKDRVLAMSGPELDLRMLVQWSVFTIHASEKAMNELPGNEEYLKEIIIPAEDRYPLRQAVKIIGFSKSRLFPDLQSLAEDLRNAEYK
jgi:hypothetical protein